MSQKNYECPACGSSKTIPAMPNGKIPTKRRREETESSDCQEESDSVDRLCKICQHRFALGKNKEND